MATVVDHLQAPVANSTRESQRNDVAFRKGIERVLFGLVAAMLLVRVVLVWHLNVNWDEFYFLSLVHDLLNERLSLPLQTLHTRLFGWVAAVSANEVDQVIAARVVYYGLTIGSCALLYRLSRSFVSHAGALFTVLCYLSYSNILAHGLTFRTDGLASFLTLAALASIVAAPRSVAASVLAGGLTASALLVTIKSAFAVPTTLALVVIGAWQGGRRDVATRIAAHVAAVAIVFTVGYVGHSFALSGASATAAADYSVRAGSMVLRSGLLPGLPYVLNTIAENGFVWISLVVGVVLTWNSRRTGRAQTDVIALLALTFPLLSLVLYRNAFPYFFVFLIPPVLVLCGVCFDGIAERARDQGSYQRIALYLIAGVTWAFSLRFGMLLPNRVEHQRQIVAAVHGAFPKPVPYLDRNGMIASFRKVGFFMTTWGVQVYRAAGRPVFEELIRDHAPPLLVTNSPDLVLRWADTLYTGPPRGGLFDSDVQVLRDNYVHFWGPLYIAGKRASIPTAGRLLSILIPGPYVLDSRLPVQIGVGTYRSGDVVQLGAGEHRVEPHGGPTELTLRWALVGQEPRARPPRRRIYTGF